jgi:hypothetical protein
MAYRMERLQCTKKLILFFSLFCFLEGKSQISSDPNRITQFQPRELTIPTSPLFDMMGIAPSQVARSSDIKDFKVDWSLKNWKLNPNLSIQAQPVWEIFYNKKNIDKYQNATYLQRTLASMDLSIGTIQTESNDRRMGAALKINLYKQADPLMVKGVYEEIDKIFELELVDLKNREKIILAELDTLTIPSQIRLKREELKNNDVQIASVSNRKNTARQTESSKFVTDNWNASFIDLAFGKIYTYSTDSAGNFKKLQLSRNSANGLWINFGKGIGKRGLLSGLLRTSFFKEQVSFNVRDNATGMETARNVVSANNVFTFGLNYRYGGPIFNFFIEMINEVRKKDILSEVITATYFGPTGMPVVDGSARFVPIDPYTINLGGDWRVSRNVILNYGIRCIFNSSFKATNLVPVANIACMMR